MGCYEMTGIRSKGYGKVYKLVMCNPQIPLCAKALYAYLCSYAGNRQIAFPKREKMLRDLHISRNTFTKHLGTLVDAGYITRTKTSSGNTYEILSQVPDSNGVTVEIKGKGYGIIPKLVMLDQRLPAQAKGLYAYFCGYAGSEKYAYPHRNTILRELDIGMDAYYRYYGALEVLGYITPVQGTADNGQFTATNFHLNEHMGECDTGNGKEWIEKTWAASALPVCAQMNCKQSASVESAPKNSCDIDSATSQKGGHGDPVENLLVANPMSQKEGHGKTVYGYLRHPYTNNTMTINIPSSYEEGKDIIIMAPQAQADEMHAVFPTLVRPGCAQRLSLFCAGIGEVVCAAMRYRLHKLLKSLRTYGPCVQRPGVVRTQAVCAQSGYGQCVKIGRKIRNQPRNRGHPGIRLEINMHINRRRFVCRNPSEQTQPCQRSCIRLGMSDGPAGERWTCIPLVTDG